MNATEPNPTDVIAQERAKAASAAKAEAPLHEVELRRLLSEPGGRAFLFSLIAAAGTWGHVYHENADDLGARNWGADWLAKLIDENPMAVGSMWAEAMTREFEKRKGVTS